MFQQITLVGNLGSDPEMRFTPSGVPVATFSLAVNKTWTGNDGQRQQKTTWFRVTTWRRQAEIVSQYLTKGRQVLVVGEVEDPYVFVGQDGSPRASLQVTARTVQMLGGRGDSAMAPEAPAGEEAPAAGAEGGESGEEDIPF